MADAAWCLPLAWALSTSAVGLACYWVGWRDRGEGLRAHRAGRFRACLLDPRTDPTGRVPARLAAAGVRELLAADRGRGVGTVSCDPGAAPGPAQGSPRSGRQPRPADRARDR